MAERGKWGGVGGFREGGEREEKVHCINIIRTVHDILFITITE